MSGKSKKMEGSMNKKGMNEKMKKNKKERERERFFYFSLELIFFENFDVSG